MVMGLYDCDRLFLGWHFAPLWPACMITTGFALADLLSNGNGPACVRPAFIRLTCCLMARACISTVSCSHAVVLTNGNGPVCERSTVLKLTFCIMVTDLYDQFVWLVFFYAAQICWVNIVYCHASQFPALSWLEQVMLWILYIICMLETTSKCH